MVVRSLIDQGVKHVFGYPGGAVLDIYDALHTVGGIDHVLVRHEQGAVHMADGYARATGDVGVVLVTSVPAQPMRSPVLPRLIWIPFHWWCYQVRSTVHSLVMTRSRNATWWAFPARW